MNFKVFFKTVHRPLILIRLNALRESRVNWTPETSLAGSLILPPPGASGKMRDPGNEVGTAAQNGIFFVHACVDREAVNSLFVFDKDFFEEDI